MTAFRLLLRRLPFRLPISDVLGQQFLEDRLDGPSQDGIALASLGIPASARFYAWLLNIWPKEWTHRYATFIRPDLKLNFVLLVADGKELHQDTLYHLGVEVANKAEVIDAYHLAASFAATIEKPPRTTWKGTPLHELWLRDPDGNLVEIYARLTTDELALKPLDEVTESLVPGTGP